MGNKFYSTKRFGPISTGHRQWRADNHCSLLHGYGRIVEIKFGAYELDDKGWVVDFGGLKDIKNLIEKHWDHKMLIASNDPMLDKLEEMQKAKLIELTILYPPYNPGIELSAQWVFDKAEALIKKLYLGRCWVEEVRVWEHENNSAICRRQ